MKPGPGRAFFSGKLFRLGKILIVLALLASLEGRPFAVLGLLK